MSLPKPPLPLPSPARGEGLLVRVAKCIVRFFFYFLVLSHQVRSMHPWLQSRGFGLFSIAVKIHRCFCFVATLFNGFGLMGALGDLRVFGKGSGFWVGIKIVSRFLQPYLGPKPGGSYQDKAFGGKTRSPSGDKAIKRYNLAVF